jgi:hypothetical protein
MVGEERSREAAARRNTNSRVSAHDGGTGVKHEAANALIARPGAEARWRAQQPDGGGTAPARPGLVVVRLGAGWRVSIVPDDKPRVADELFAPAQHQIHFDRERIRQTSFVSFCRSSCEPEVKRKVTSANGSGVPNTKRAQDDVAYANPGHFRRHPSRIM